MRQEADPESAEACSYMMKRLTWPMPEDWAYEEEIRTLCQSDLETFCPFAISGQGRLNACLRCDRWTGT